MIGDMGPSDSSNCGSVVVGGTAGEEVERKWPGPDVDCVFLCRSKSLPWLSRSVLHSTTSLCSEGALDLLSKGAIDTSIM